MNILIAAATEAELAPFIAHLSANWSIISKNVYQQNNLQVVVLVTGVGMVATAYTLTRALSAVKYDFVIQAGVAGSFNKNIGIGDTVFITCEQWGDLGAEDNDSYLNVFDMGLQGADTYPYEGGKLNSSLSDIHDGIKLPQVSGLTVNMVSGKAQTIDRLGRQYGCDVESMEGAAFHYVCLMEQIPFAQIRTISNYVEPRDRSKWKIGPAIQNLNNWLTNYVSHL